MKTLSILIVPVLIICVGFLAFAQDTPETKVENSNEKFLLKWNFAKDASLKYEIKTESSSDIENQGSTITEMKSLTSNVSLKCNEVKDESMMIEMKYDRIRFNQFSSQFPEQIRFDSNKKEDVTNAKYDNAMLPYSSIVKKDRSFTFDLTGIGEVSNVKGYDKLLDDIYADLDDPIYKNTKEEISKSFSNAVMEETLGGLFGILPKTPMSKGMSWDKSYTTSILYVGEVKVTSTFTLDRVYKEGDKFYAEIKLDSKAETVKPVEEETEIIKDFKVKGTLAGSELSGSLVFNITDGNIKTYEATQKLNFTIKVISDGRTIEAGKTVTNKISMQLMSDEVKPEDKKTEDDNKE